MTGSLVAVAGCLAQQQSGGGSGFHVVVAPAAATSIGTISDTVTATASGGTSPYTYSWSLESGTGIFISAPTSAATTFFCLGHKLTEGVAVCTVKDDDGAIATSNDVQIVLLAEAGEGND